MGIIQGFVLSVLCVLAVVVAAEPVAYVPAVGWGVQNDWRSRQSAHFEIVYPDGLQAMAEHALLVAEQVHTNLAVFFVQVPAERTLLVLVDDFDTANGFATPLPRAAIRLFASPPDGATGLEEYDDWLHLLIRHEYAHILHLELGRGVVDRSRQVFGRTFFNFPHLFTPPFMIEGLAVYLETSRSQGYGRLQGSFYAMAMRAEMLDSGGDRISEAAVALRDWPLDKSYLYGAWFIDWLVRHYGEDKLREFLLLYSGRLLPYWSLEQDARRVFGHSFSYLWRGFLADWQQQALRWQQHQPALNEGAPIPMSTLFRPLLATDGRQLFSIERNGDDREVLRRRDPRDPESVVELGYTDNVRALAVAPGGQIALVRWPNRAGGQVWGDVWLWRAGDSVRLSQDLRARRLAWRDDGKTLVVSRIVAGRSELLTLDVSSGETASLWQGGAGDVMGEFDVRPDGQYLVAAVKRRGSGWDLEQLDLRTGQWQRLTETIALENSPRYAANGDVLFSADNSGQFDLYRLTPGSTERLQLSRVSTAAFAPLLVGDRLLYSRYTAQGYRVEALSASAPVLAMASNDSGARQYLQEWPGEVLLAPETGYSPWHTLLPTAWYPSFSANRYHVEAGVLVSGTDALGRHRYSAQLREDFQHGLTSGLLDYALDNRWSLRAQRHFRYPVFEDRDYQIIRRDDLALQRNYLWSALEDRLQLSAGVVYARESLYDDRGQDWSGLRSAEQGLAGLALVLDDRQSLLNIPGYAYGRRLDLVLETNDWLPGDYQGEQLQGRWQEILDLPGRDTLGWHLYAGGVDHRGGRFMLGGGPSYDESLFGRDTVALMGYPEGVRYGTRYHHERLAWTHWLGRAEDNLHLLPLGSGDYSMTLYAEAGAAWNYGQPADWLPAVGVEARAEVVLGYRMIMPVSIGFASGLDADGENQVYVGIGVNY